jgi:predicted nucleotidyltransferase component of viral defense system
MPAKTAVRRQPQPNPLIVPALTADEKARMVRHGFTEEDIARNPALRYAGVFANDPWFFEPLRAYYRETRGRDLPE